MGDTSVPLESAEMDHKVLDEDMALVLSESDDELPAHGKHNAWSCGKVWCTGLRHHYAFTFSWEYHLLFFAAVVGRALKICATLCGAILVTPVYKCFYDPLYQRTNMMYDLISPFLRKWFVRLCGPYHIHNVLRVISHHRRGAVLSEFLFVLLQIALNNVPGPLLVVTAVGVIVNTVPRQFYAQLKMMVRNLHISFLDTTMETLLEQMPQEVKKGVTFGGRPVFGEGDRETPSTYLAFRGNHHTGCKHVVVTEAIDFTFSFVGGMIMLYLLTFSTAVLLDVLGVVDREDVEDAFPFAIVTVMRLLKSGCNYMTTQNLISNVEARQGQHELYFLQRLAIVQSVYPTPQDYIEQRTQKECPRDALEFLGQPELSGLQGPPQGKLGEAIPVLCMFSFLTDSIPRQRYLDILSDGLCGNTTQTSTESGQTSAPFGSDEELNKVRAYGAELLWKIFDVDAHNTGVCKRAKEAAQ